ncbi:MAG: hypothetical protein AAF732_08275 [Pseudomonadota bacterium]
MSVRHTGQSVLWIAVPAIAALLFSLALACGMPFAALGALAALTLATREAFLLAGLGWLANQAVGFGLLGYPLDAVTFAWGAALGISALAAVCAALVALAVLRTDHSAARAAIAFLAAWTAQQVTVFAASFALPASAAAFAPSVLWFIFWTNALAFGVLFALQAAGARLGLARPPLGRLSAHAAG